jgi:hypothetical protein
MVSFPDVKPDKSLTISRELGCHQKNCNTIIFRLAIQPVACAHFSIKASPPLSSAKKTGR